MNNESQVFALEALGVLVAMVAFIIWAAIEALSRRRTRTAVVQEIMAKRYDETLMHEAIVDARGDNAAARNRYIRRRVKQERTRQRKGIANDLGQAVFSIYSLVVLVIMAFRIYNEYL